MHEAMETNFWGPIRVIKGVLPSMRARKSGTIVYISSIFGIVPCPSGAMYSCPKAAQDMLQGVINTELSLFNIRAISINAGMFRTDVLAHSKQPSGGFSDAYGNTDIPRIMGEVMKLVQNPDTMPGDPTKFGERVVEIVDGTGLGKGLEKHTRFLFGRDAAKLAEARMQELAEDFEASGKIARSTDFEDHGGEGVAAVIGSIK